MNNEQLEEIRAWLDGPLPWADKFPIDAKTADNAVIDILMKADKWIGKAILNVDTLLDEVEEAHELYASEYINREVAERRVKALEKVLDGRCISCKRSETVNEKGRRERCWLMANTLFAIFGISGSGCKYFEFDEARFSGEGDAGC